MDIIMCVCLCVNVAADAIKLLLLLLLAEPIIIIIFFFIFIIIIFETTQHYRAFFSFNLFIFRNNSIIIDKKKCFLVLF